MANNFSGDADCVALWNFEDSPGFATDSQGDNDLTNDGADEENTTYKEGSQSAKFVLSNTDYMYISDADQDAGFPFRDNDGGSVEEDFSFCFWVYFNSLPNYATLLAKWDDDDDLVFCLLVDDADKAQPVFGYNSGASYEYDTDFRFGTAFTTGRWYHVAFTYVQSTHAFRLRIWDDTASDFLGSDISDNASNDIDARDIPFTIGAQSHGAYYSDCYIDEFVVFNRSLSTDDIDAIRSGTFSSSETYEFASTAAAATSTAAIDCNATRLLASASAITTSLSSSGLNILRPFASASAVATALAEITIDNLLSFSSASGVTTLLSSIDLNRLMAIASTSAITTSTSSIALPRTMCISSTSGLTTSLSTIALNRVMELLSTSSAQSSTSGIDIVRAIEIASTAAVVSVLAAVHLYGGGIEFSSVVAVETALSEITLDWVLSGGLTEVLDDTYIRKILMNNISDITSVKDFTQARKVLDKTYYRKALKK